MKAAPAIAAILLILSAQAEARRCINGTVMAPSGACVSPDKLAAMKPDPVPATKVFPYRSCPGNMAFDERTGACTTVISCPGGMAKVGNSCQPVSRR